MKIYRGDLKPDLVVTLTDGGVPINLTSAASIRLIGTRLGVVVIDVLVTGTSQGVVTYLWAEQDTAVIGDIDIEVEVMWPGDKPQTFRPRQRVEVVTDYA